MSLVAQALHKNVADVEKMFGCAYNIIASWSDDLQSRVVSIYVDIGFLGTNVTITLVDKEKGRANVVIKENGVWCNMCFDESAFCTFFPSPVDLVAAEQFLRLHWLK